MNTQEPDLSGIIPIVKAAIHDEWITHRKYAMFAKTLSVLGRITDSISFNSMSKDEASHAIRLTKILSDLTGEPREKRPPKGATVSIKHPEHLAAAMSISLVHESADAKIYAELAAHITMARPNNYSSMAITVNSIRKDELRHHKRIHDILRG